MLVAPVLDALRDHGVLAGGSADPHVIRLMPPLTTTDAEIHAFADALDAAIQDVHASAGAPLEPA
jgi:acetylornithine aminotransferase/acetylornithine/N-succinyldiaminopimelate aminotransferase